MHFLSLEGIMEKLCSNWCSTTTALKHNDSLLLGKQKIVVYCIMVLRWEMMNQLTSIATELKKTKRMSDHRSQSIGNARKILG